MPTGPLQVSSDEAKNSLSQPAQKGEAQDRQGQGQQNSGNRPGEEIQRISRPEHDQGLAEIDFHHGSQHKSQDEGGGFKSEPPQEVT